MKVQRLSLSIPVALALSACASREPASRPVADAAMEDAVEVVPAVACDDDEETLYEPPFELPRARGAILRCTNDGSISEEQIAGRLSALVSDNRKSLDGSDNPAGVRNTYQGRAPEGGARLYRVLYRTERGHGEPGYSVASIYVPEKLKAARLPLLLLARGSRGQAADCAPSRYTEGAPTYNDSQDGRAVHNDHEAMLWPLVASGFIVIATDSAGYAGYGAEGNPPSAYADVKDMGKSFIDSAHALRQFLPEATTDQVLMVGLSQGGHTVLGALEVSNDYPAPGPIEGAVVYAPLWFSQRAWGVVMTPIAAAVGVVLNKSSGVPVSFWYHYTKAEMYDGPGEGVKLFKPELRGVVKDFVDTTCWSRQYNKLAESGLAEGQAPRSTGADFFEPAMVASVGPAALERNCDKAPDKALCEKWLQRYRDDHPTFTGAAAKIPVLLAYGLRDNSIGPARLRCGVDKLVESKTPLTLCIDPKANHAGIVLSQSEYVNQWLLNKAFGEEIGTSCPDNELPADLTCDSLLPND